MWFRQDSLAFELPNVGPGPDPCSLSALTANEDFAVLYFQRDYDCANCRTQARQVRDRYEMLRTRNAVAAAVLPNAREEAAQWFEEFDLPFPVLADEDGSVASAYGQPNRLEFLRISSAYTGRQPTVVVVDARRGEPERAWRHRGRAVYDRPTTNDVVGVLDDLRE